MSNPSNKRFLFVDDDADFLEIVRQIFGQMSGGNWEIGTATNHSQALKQIAKQTPDVVVLDYSMPVMDGFGFLRLLRQTHPGLQVVMLTGRTDEETRKACLDNGAALFLEKILKPEGYEGVYTALDALAHAVPQPGFRGSMRRVGLQDVLKMECACAKSCVLDVFAGTTRGRIYVRDGAIIHAESGDLEGEVALYGLLALRDGEFNLLPFTPPQRSSISGQYEFLLMEAARLRDEETRLLKRSAAAATAGTAGGSVPQREEPSAGEVAHEARIEEVVLSSGGGELLYERGCLSVDRALGLLAQVEQQGMQLRDLIPGGQFEGLEITLPSGRVVCRFQSHMRLLVHSTTEAPSNP